MILLTLVMRLRQVNMFTARAREGQRLNTTLCEKQIVRPQTVGLQSRAAGEQTSRQFSILAPWSVRALPHVHQIATLDPVHFAPMEFVSFCRDVHDFIPAAFQLCDTSCTFVWNSVLCTQHPCHRASRKKHSPYRLMKVSSIGTCEFST